jgi:acyl-CoA synthetase (AMP-forming)/AMP-acid ligase II
MKPPRVEPEAWWGVVVVDTNELVRGLYATPDEAATARAALVGGRVKLMVSGSAPLSRETQRFAQTVFNCPVRQGYGVRCVCELRVMRAAPL